MRSSEDTLKEIAFHFGVTGLAAAHIAVNRLHLELFYGQEEYEFPSAEQIKGFEDSLGAVEIIKSQTLIELIAGKTKREQELIGLFYDHLQTFEFDMFTEGTLSGMISAWAMCGAISKETWAELDALRAARKRQLKKPKRIYKQTQA